MAYSTNMAAQDTSGDGLARTIVARLRAAGAQAYYAGGCVRDVSLVQVQKRIAEAALYRKIVREHLPRRVQAQLPRDRTQHPHDLVRAIAQKRAQIPF